MLLQQFELHNGLTIITAELVHGMIIIFMHQYWYNMGVNVSELKITKANNKDTAKKKKKHNIKKKKHYIKSAKNAGLPYMVLVLY